MKSADSGSLESWKILVPSTDSSEGRDIVSAPSRSIVYYNEILRFFVVGPKISDRDSVKKLSIQVIGKLGSDLSIQESFGSLFNEASSKNVSISNNQNQPLFATVYNVETDPPIFGDDYTIFPCSMELDMRKRKPGKAPLSVLLLHAHILQKPAIVNIDNQFALNGIYEYCNPLLPITDVVSKDATFLPLRSNKPEIAGTVESGGRVIKNSAFMNLKIAPLLNVQFEIFTPAPDLALLAIRISTNYGMQHNCILREIQPRMQHVVFNSEPSVQEEFTISKNDEVMFLFKLQTALDSSSLSFDSNQAHVEGSVVNLAIRESNDILNSRMLYLAVKSQVYSPGCHSQNIVSRFHHSVSFSHADMPFAQAGVMRYGRQFQTPVSIETAKLPTGLNVSFSVMPNIKLRKVFEVQVLLINTSSSQMNLTLSIPKSEARQGLSSIDPDRVICSLESLGEAYKSRFHHSSSIVCLEESIELKSIPVQSCKLITLHFIVINGHVHSLPTVVIKNDSGREWVILDALQIYVEN